MIVYLTRKIRKHYDSIASQLSLEGTAPETEFKRHTVIVPVSRIQRAVLNAVKYAKVLSEDVVAVYVCFNPDDIEAVRRKWEKFYMGVPLVVLDSPYRSVIEPLMEYIDDVRVLKPDWIITVVLPEFVPQKWWHHLLHNQTALLIKGNLLFKRDVVVTSVPLHLS